MKVSHPTMTQDDLLSVYSHAVRFSTSRKISVHSYTYDMDSINFMSSFGGFLALTKQPTNETLQQYEVGQFDAEKWWRRSFPILGFWPIFRVELLNFRGRREFFQSAPAKPSQDGFWGTFLGYTYWIPHSQLTFFYLTLHLFFYQERFQKWDFPVVLPWKFRKLFTILKTQNSGNTSTLRVQRPLYKWSFGPYLFLVINHQQFQTIPGDYSFNGLWLAGSTKTRAILEISWDALTDGCDMLSTSESKRQTWKLSGQDLHVGYQFESWWMAYLHSRNIFW